MNFLFLTKRHGVSLAGIFSLALCSLVLLCAAGPAVVDFLPQGAMQGDLNAGGHSLTNIATVNATNVVASGSLTVPGGFTLSYAQLSGAPALGSLALISPGGTPAATTFLKYDGTNFTYTTPPAANVLSVAGRTGAITLSAADISGLAASATTDTTSAGNITSGTLAAARVATLNQNTTGSAASFTGALAGDVTGSQAATTVGKINGTAIPTASSNALGKTPNTAGGVVTQDASSTVNVYQLGIPTGPVVNLIALGDSLTSGYGSLGSFTAATQGNFSFPAYLASSPLFYNGTVVNTGVGGASTAGVASGYDPGSPTTPVFATTVTTTLGSTTATITGSTTGIPAGSACIVSPNTPLPSATSVGTYTVVLSGTALTMSQKATATGSCTMYFGTGSSPATFTLPLRNAVVAAISARLFQPLFTGTSAYVSLWVGTNDCVGTPIAGYATSSGTTLTFQSATLTSACTWTSSSPNITVAQGTSLAGVTPGQSVQTATGMASSLYVSTVDYVNNIITLSGNPSGSGTSATLVFQPNLSSALVSGGYTAYYSGSNSDASTGTASSYSSGLSITMASAPGISGTQLIVFCPSQTTERTAYQNLVTQLISDNAANGVILFTLKPMYGPGQSTATAFQGLCNGACKAWTSWMLSTFASVSGAHIFRVDQLPIFANGYNPTYSNTDGCHILAAGHQQIAQALQGFIQTTYNPTFSGRVLYPLTGTSTITRNQVDHATVYTDGSGSSITMTVPMTIPTATLTGATTISDATFNTTTTNPFVISNPASTGRYIITYNSSSSGAGLKKWGFANWATVGEIFLQPLNDDGSDTSTGFWLRMQRNSSSAATALIAGCPFTLKGYTVGTLPTGVTGATAYVTDATSPTYNGALTGGGSVVAKVFYNGTAWVAQ